MNVTERIANTNLDLSVLKEYARREREFMQRAADLEAVTKERDGAKQAADDLRNQRLREFMSGFGIISMKLKEMYQVGRKSADTLNWQTLTLVSSVYR